MGLSGAATRPPEEEGEGAFSMICRETWTVKARLQKKKRKPLVLLLLE